MSEVMERPADESVQDFVMSAIQSRKTSKVLLPVELRHEQQALWTEEHNGILQRILQSAGWAPFHKRAQAQHLISGLDAPMPWRFHVVDSEACTRLLAFLENQASTFPDSRWVRAWQSKIKELISGCGVLIQVTWLPEPVSDKSEQVLVASPDFTQKNIEHVAAAASAVQNILIAAQSCQWLSYWSSGGILKDEEVFDYMNIDRREQLLGSVFLTPQAHSSARIMEGGLREQRGELSGWVRWV